MATTKAQTGKTPKNGKAGKPYRFAGTTWYGGGFGLEGVGSQGAATPQPPGGFSNYFSVHFLNEANKQQWQLGKRPVPCGSSLAGEVQSALQHCDPALVDAIEAINRWMQDMTSWAKAVREDIRNLEEHCGLEQGDPGDPPPVPWK